jgi:hypothetical protein
MDFFSVAQVVNALIAFVIFYALANGMHCFSHIHTDY